MTLSPYLSEADISRRRRGQKRENPRLDSLFFGTADGIRTHDLQSRSLALYPAELQPHIRLFRQKDCPEALFSGALEYYSKFIWKSK